MEEKKNKCPLCSKRLVMKDGVPTCPDCGYRDPYRSSGSQSQADYSRQPQVNYNQPQTGYNQQQSGAGYSQQPQTNYNQPQTNYDQSQANNVRQPQMNYGQQAQGNYGQPQGNYNQQPKLGPYAAVVSPSGNEKEKKEFSVGAVLAVVAVIISAVTGVVAAISTSYGRYSDVRDEITWGGNDSHRQSSAAASVPAADHQQSSSSASGRENNSVSHLTFDPPESELLQEFVSQLFDKPAASVTREDLNSVIKLEIRDLYNYNGTEIIYELSDGTAGNCYLSSSRLKTEDFKCFPNLQTLDLGRSTLDWGTDWHNLTSLTSLTCEAALRDLAGYMDVSQLTALDLTRDFSMSDLSALGEYSNLEYLRLDGDDYVLDLTGLSQASALKTLIIEDGDGISDFEELYALTQLRELSIESSGLRDIGFVSDMTELESLELCNTKLMQITAVSDRADTLKCLRLHQNYSVEDYSPVFDCTGLEELELYVKYDFDTVMEMPDLSMMPELKSLTLGNYDHFSGLGNLTTLESLTLADASSFGGSGELTGLKGLSNLKSLSLIDMSVEPDFLESFAVVTSLENVDMTQSFIWGDINAVFGLPNLRTLNLEWATFGLNLEEMPVSESLQELNMTYAAVSQLKDDGSWNYSAGSTQINLGDHTEFFDHTPNLTVLDVPGHELQDVKFAENLTQLTYLNIVNNYVTDLSPLAGLGQLKVILCENNPVHSRTGLKNVIIID